MAFTIDQITLQDFMAFREAAFHFKEEPGITLIIGPNGVGKSTLFDAISWCLYDRLISGKRVKAGEVRHRHDDGKGRCSVIFDLRIGNRKITVTRGRTTSGPQSVRCGWNPPTPPSNVNSTTCFAPCA